MTDQPEHPDYDGPSKSQLKRDSHMLQKMGQELVDMPEGMLQKFDLPENLQEAVHEARRLKSREAKRFYYFLHHFSLSLFFFFSLSLSLLNDSLNL